MKRNGIILSCIIALLIAGIWWLRTFPRPFTFIVLPDSQTYIAQYPDTFTDQIRWIVREKNRLNIQFVFHLGDIVQEGKNEKGWTIASDGFRLLDEARVPYGIVTGNNDVDDADSPTRTFTMFTRHFPSERFQSRAWYGGNFPDNRNSFQLLNIYPWKFLILNLEPEPTEDVVQWARGIFAQFPDRKAIISTHIFLDDASGERFKSVHFRKDGYTPEKLWNELIRDTCSIFLVLSGHSHEASGEHRRVDPNRCGKPVHQITQNYQSREQGNSGLLRIFTFNPQQHVLEITTFSPNGNNPETDSDSQFTIPLPF